ncbi:MAG: vWA domain-containing protein [Phycisphaeraceae bacterium]
MKTRLTLTASLAALALSVAVPLSAEEPAKSSQVQTAPVVEAKAVVKPGQKQPVIQLAILLDTSNSMDGLIDQAKSQLWKVVNQFIAVQRDGQRPLLQVALFEYGNDSLSAKENHIRLVLPLTDDLDKVSQELFALKTNGGEEYCGAVIKAAIERLEWSKNNADLKVVYIAGNEPFGQGPIDFRESCKSAITKGIQINTIFCGNVAEGINTNWKDGAVLADGQFISIDSNVRVVDIEAPQDKELAALNTKLNGTFVPYGKHGEEGKANQAAQDANSAGLSGANLAQRAVAKGSANYRNSMWCLVDAITLDNVDITKVKEEDLPENMKKMSMDERKAYLEGKKKEREDLQKQMAALSIDRQKYVDEAMKKEAEKTGKETLDSAVIKSVRKQAEAKNYKFEQ